MAILHRFTVYLVDDSVFINWWRGQGAWLYYDHWPRGDSEGPRTKVSDLYRFAFGAVHVELCKDLLLSMDMY